MLDFKEATRIVLARWEHALGVNFSVSYPVLMSLGKANALISASVGFSDGSAAAFGGTLRIFERHNANAELLNWARTEQLFDDYDEPTNPLWVESLGVAATVREDGSIDLAARGKAANVRPHAGDVQAFLLSLSGEDEAERVNTPGLKSPEEPGVTFSFDDVLDRVASNPKRPWCDCGIGSTHVQGCPNAAK